MFQSRTSSTVITRRRRRQHQPKQRLCMDTFDKDGISNQKWLFSVFVFVPIVYVVEMVVVLVLVMTIVTTTRNDIGSVQSFQSHSYRVYSKHSLIQSSLEQKQQLFLTPTPPTCNNNNHSKQKCNCLLYRSIAQLKVSTSVLFMGKGDGKKKRPKTSTTKTSSPLPPVRTSNTLSSQQETKTTSVSKKKSSSSLQSSSSSSPTTPLRVSSNTNIPVRVQLKWAQINKEIQKQQQKQSSTGTSTTSSSSSNSYPTTTKTVKPTRYRRTWDEEEIEQKAIERKNRGKEPDWDIILSRNASIPLLIVDGYNVIYKWNRLKKFMVQGDLAQARRLLVDDCENLQSIKGWRIEIVFDGAKRGSIVGPLGHGVQRKQQISSTTSSSTSISSSPEFDKRTRKDVTKHGVRVVYTGAGIEADTYIEQRCMEAKKVSNSSGSSSSTTTTTTTAETTGSLIIATDDTMIRIVGTNCGAVCMSTTHFINELCSLEQIISFRVEAAMAKVNHTPIRPKQLHGSTTVFTGNRFGRHSVVLEDKRKNKNNNTNSNKIHNKET